MSDTLCCWANGRILLAQNPVNERYGDFSPADWLWSANTGRI
jgi:hypothetical protein